MKKINFGCGSDWREGFINVDYPEIDLNKRLTYQDKEYDYGVCRCVVPYLKNVSFSIEEMKRVCRELEVSLPHWSGGTPNQIGWGKVYYHGFGLKQILLLKPDKIRVKLYWPFGEFNINPKKNWQLKLGYYWEIYLSGLIRARNIWLYYGDVQNEE